MNMVFMVVNKQNPTRSFFIWMAAIQNVTLFQSWFKSRLFGLHVFFAFLKEVIFLQQPTIHSLRIL